MGGARKASGRLLGVAVVAALSLVLASCASPNRPISKPSPTLPTPVVVPSGWHSLSYAQGNFTVSYPARWQAGSGDPEVDTGQWVQLNPPDKDIPRYESVLVMISMEGTMGGGAPETSVTVAAENQRARLRDEEKEATKWTESKTAIDGSNGYMFEVHTSLNPPPPYNQFEPCACVVHVYLVQWEVSRVLRVEVQTTTPALWSAYSTTGEQIVRTIHHMATAANLMSWLGCQPIHEFEGGIQMYAREREVCSIGPSLDVVLEVATFATSGDEQKWEQLVLSPRVYVVGPEWAIAVPNETVAKQVQGKIGGTIVS